ncbi:MAG TPA: hypothetical protein PKZ76_15015 [Xanthomonadaceae bacterium]|nr:hypothetical protein [Xanthomonadaceae bacterium]
MAYNRVQAQKLLSATEFALFEASRGEVLAALSAAQLKSKITRTRRLRDKQRDLLQRQRLASRKMSGAKDGSSGVANVRTAQKAQIFDEALARLEKRAAEIERRTAAEARRASARKAAAVRKAAKRPQPKKAAAKRARKAPARTTSQPGRKVSAKAAQPLPSASPELPPKKRQMGKQRTRGMMGSVSTAGRRAQGRKDSR